MMRCTDVNASNGTIPFARKLSNSLAILFGLAFANLANAQSSLPAFPQAQGGGAASVGGRGGAVMLVTNLNDSGPGSLRACVDASGPRTCVFRVSGIIELTSSFYVTNPFLTIAGQTAPGGGITLSGRRMCNHAVLFPTHDVIVRYIRVRHGFNSDHSCGGINIANFPNAYNVIIDHVSMSWSNTNDVAGLDSSDPSNTRLTNETWSWNLMAEPLSGQPTEFVASCRNPGCDATTDIDLHHNVMMSASYRIPLISIKSGRFVNNIVYNSGRYYSAICPGVMFDFVNNKYALGPLQVFSWGHYTTIREVQIASTCSGGQGVSSPNGTASLHMSGNVGPNNSSPSGNQWQMTALLQGDPNSPEIQSPVPSGNQRTTPLAVSYPYPITPDQAANLDDVVLPTVGASRRLGCDGVWVDNRDSVDARLVQQYRTNTGIASWPHSENDVGGFPAIAAGAPCAMTVPDGIPDEWKRAHGLDPNGPSRANDIAQNGYTYLENYLNGASASTGPGPGPGPSVKLPDLIVTSISYDSTTGLFTSVVKNIGSAPTPEGIVIGNGFSVDDRPVTWGSVPGPLAPGASVTIDSSGGGAYAIPNGTHRISVEANAFGCCGRFEEADRTNNTLAQTITVCREKR